MAVQPGLCRTRSDTRRPVFSQRGSNIKNCIIYPCFRCLSSPYFAVWSPRSSLLPSLLNLTVSGKPSKLPITNSTKMTSNLSGKPEFYVMQKVHVQVDIVFITKHKPIRHAQNIHRSWKGLGKNSPFHRFTKDQRYKSVYVW